MTWNSLCTRLNRIADREVGLSVPPDRLAAGEGDNPGAIRTDPACGRVAHRRYQAGAKILQSFQGIDQPLTRDVASGAA